MDVERVTKEEREKREKERYRHCGMARGLCRPFYFVSVDCDFRLIEWANVIKLQLNIIFFSNVVL